MGAVRDVLIVGGGIAGMTLAMGLSRHGIKSDCRTEHRLDGYRRWNFYAGSGS
jgi:cation diffusion facilitator CzcD-associated flavoprotein CzcO